MLVNEFIRIPKKGLRKIKHYEKIGYSTDSEFIIIKVSDLTPGSRQKIDVKCDFCNKLVNITYKEYYRNVLNNNKYACSKICGSIKAKESNIIKYGVEYPMILKDIQEKAKKTNIKKYGTEYLQQSEFIKNKTQRTLLDKYGVYHISKSEEIRKKTSKISLDDNYINYIGENLSLFKCEYVGHNFSISNDNYFQRKKNNLPICTICNPIGDSKSIKEEQIFEFIKSIYSDNIIRTYRDGLEIDIYLPKIKLGFEFNGLYWHSDNFIDKRYHLNKTEYFSEKGIRIIHIWEDDWINKRNIIESQIKNLLGLTENKIFARRCQIREIKDSKISTKFLNENHIQGSVRSNLKLGLYYGNELVSLMTFDNYEGRKKMEAGGWNLSRFCNKLNTNVIGGASKILKYFIKNYKVFRLISYADRDWSIGNLYEKLGFKRISESKPDYKYIINKNRIHKSRFRKSFTNISESKLNIPKVWDCGKIKFEKIINLF